MENSQENFIDPEAGRLLWLRSLEQRDRKHYFRSGFKTQDQAIGAWERATLNSVGGFTGAGKTAYLSSMGYRMAREHGTRVFYFNLEMSVPAMWNRLACIHDPALKLMEFRDREITPERARYLIELSRKLSNFSPYFFENPDIKEVIKAALAKIERGSDSILIIDYFALLSMKGFGPTERFSLQAECAKLLKHLATHLDVPIITAIQLNPSIEQKKDQRPSLADFRGDKEVIHHSNVVLALTHPRRTELEVYCLKNRNGPLATFSLEFVEERAAIEEFDYD
jgi:replicative DNA helicase